MTQIGRAGRSRRSIAQVDRAGRSRRSIAQVDRAGRSCKSIVQVDRASRSCKSIVQIDRASRSRKSIVQVDCASRSCQSIAPLGMSRHRRVAARLSRRDDAARHGRATITSPTCRIPDQVEGSASATQPAISKPIGNLCFLYFHIEFLESGAPQARPPLRVVSIRFRSEKAEQRWIVAIGIACNSGEGA